MYNHCQGKIILPVHYIAICSEASLLLILVLFKSSSWQQLSWHQMFDISLTYLAGINCFCSWFILHICTLASSWYPGRNLWLLSPFWVSHDPTLSHSSFSFVSFNTYNTRVRLLSSTWVYGKVGKHKDLWMTPEVFVIDTNIMSACFSSSFLCLVFYIYVRFYAFSGFWPSIKAYLYQIPVFGWILQYPTLVSTFNFQNFWFKFLSRYILTFF